MVKIGIIAGSGIDDKLNMTDVKRVKAHTPYGAVSDLLILGKINGKECVGIPRHGAHHSLMPSLVNYRANIWALKDQGVTHIIALSACGSLREKIEPGHLVFPDQFIDRTTRRAQTFYEGQRVAHIGMAEPFCPKLRGLFAATAAKLKYPHHAGATVITIEGPRFSTRAESRMFRAWGADIINMSTVPEVVLAREAGMCYAVIAMSSDYDAWHISKETVTVDLILRTMSANVEKVNRIIPLVMDQITAWPCDCHEAWKQALL